jgi:hypothetical protein
MAQVATTTDSGIRRDDGAADSFIHGMRRRFTIDVYSSLLENLGRIKGPNYRVF